MILCIHRTEVALANLSRREVAHRLIQVACVECGNTMARLVFEDDRAFAYHLRPSAHARSNESYGRSPYQDWLDATSELRRSRAVRRLEGFAPGDDLGDDTMGLDEDGQEIWNRVYEDVATLREMGDRRRAELAEESARNRQRVDWGSWHGDRTR